MSKTTEISAMADFFSAAFWLPELRSRAGVSQWVERCSDLGLRRIYLRVSVYGDFLHHTRVERRLSATLVDNYKSPEKKRVLSEICG